MGHISDDFDFYLDWVDDYPPEQRKYDEEHPSDFVYDPNEVPF